MVLMEGECGCLAGRVVVVIVSDGAEQDMSSTVSRAETPLPAQAHLSITTSLGSTGPMSEGVPAGQGMAPPPTSSNQELGKVGLGLGFGSWVESCSQSGNTNSRSRQAAVTNNQAAKHTGT